MKNRTPASRFSWFTRTVLIAAAPLAVLLFLGAKWVAAPHRFSPTAEIEAPIDGMKFEPRAFTPMAAAPEPDKDTYAPDTAAVRALHTAIQRNDVAAARKAFADGADANATVTVVRTAWRGKHTTEYKATATDPLLFRISYGGDDDRQKAVALFRLFLAHGVSMKAQNAQGQTPLFAALFLEDAALVKEVVARGADVHATYVDTIGGSGNAINAVNVITDGATPSTDTKILPLLLFFLEKRVDPNRYGVGGMTPLQQAAFTGSPHTVAALIAHGANVRAKTQSGLGDALPAGSTAIELASFRGNPDVLRLLSQATPGLSAAEAAATGATNALADLLTSGTNPNAVGPENEPLLSLAIRSGSAKTVRLLLERGASVEAREPSGGANALIVAASLGQTEMARALLDYHADPNAQRNAVSEKDRRFLRMKNPLCAAIEAPSPSTVALLIKRGATVEGSEPLERAVRNAGELPRPHRSLQSRSRVLRGDALLDAQGSVFEQILEKTNVPKNGGPALLAALERDQWGLAQALLDSGANPNARDEENKTPLLLTVSGIGLNRHEISQEMLSMQMLSPAEIKDLKTNVAENDKNALAVLRKLLRRRADVNAVASPRPSGAITERTALSAARFWKLADVEVLLKKAGATQ